MSIDIINVTDAPYSADNTGATDASGDIQDAIDAAFGTSGSPHGATNCHLNKPLYFPAGIYRIDTPLDFTQVCGGWIFGDGRDSTSITFDNTTGGFQIDGMSGTLIENLRVYTNNFAAVDNTIAIDLDWGGTNPAGAVGLSRNIFSNMAVAGSTGIRVANSGNEGHGNTFRQCQWAHCEGSAGLHIVGADASGNFADHSHGSYCNRSVKIDGGSTFTWVAITESWGDPGTESARDLEITNDCICCVIGARSEYYNFVTVSGAATLIVSGLDQHNGALTFGAINNANATVIVDGSRIMPVTGSGGNWYSRGTYWVHDGGAGAGTFGALPNMSGFSGTIKQRV